MTDCAVTGRVPKATGAEGVSCTPTMMAFIFLPMSSVIAVCYVIFAIVFVTGLVSIFLRRSWQDLPGIDKAVLLGPIFYGAPLAAFGTEHFTLARGVAMLVPQWIPWHLFWTYLIGACFIAAGFSLVTGIQSRLTAGLLAITFFLFVALMDAPAWAHHPRNWISTVLMLRQLAFSGGALALYASLAGGVRKEGSGISAAIARYFVAVPVVVYAVEQFLHPDHVPGIPLEKLTPGYVPAHAVWSYVCAVIFVIAAILLLVGKKTRLAALSLGLTVLLVELIVYLPIAVVERSTLEGFNYMADTLMFCGALLLLARAMPISASSPSS